MNHVIVDHHGREKLEFWSKRLTYPVLNYLDKQLSAEELILSGEFTGRINPESYRISDGTIALLLCSDERLNHLNLMVLFEAEREGAPIFPVRLPGAVVGQDIGKLKEKLKDFDFSKLAAASHADCGAASLDLLGKGLSVDTDQHARDLVSDLPGIENWGFIDKTEDPELKGIHSASCLLVDTTGRRNFLPDGILPQECFMVNRAVYFDPELAKSHIKVLTKIALGKHGIGLSHNGQELGFSSKNPFYIFVNAFDHGNLRQYMTEAENLASDLPEGCVRIVGFLAPKVD